MFMASFVVSHLRQLPNKESRSPHRLEEKASQSGVDAALAEAESWKQESARAKQVPAASPCARPQMR